VPIQWALRDALGNSISSLATMLKMESVFNGQCRLGCVASAPAEGTTLQPCDWRAGGATSGWLRAITNSAGTRRRRRLCRHHGQGLLHRAHLPE
jgi:hypothetical protein